MHALTKIAVLFSGAGSNLDALARHINQKNVPAEIVLAIYNNPNAAGIDVCKNHNLVRKFINPQDYQTRAEFDATLGKILTEAGVTLICAAGFMRLLTPDFVRQWENKILNIHPSLLPKFKGLNTHERVLKAGETEHGCSVHLMRPEMDEGEILVQKKIAILQNDTAESLSKKVQLQEHSAYPEAVDKMLEKINKTQTNNLRQTTSAQVLSPSF